MRFVFFLLACYLASASLPAQQSPLLDGGRYRSLCGREIVLKSTHQFPGNPPPIAGDSMIDRNGKVAGRWWPESNNALIFSNFDNDAAGDWRDSSRFEFTASLRDKETLLLNPKNAAARAFLDGHGYLLFYRADQVQHDEFRFERWHQSPSWGIRQVIVEKDGTVRYLSRYDVYSRWKLYNAKLSQAQLSEFIKKVNATGVYQWPEHELDDQFSDALPFTVILHYNGRRMRIKHNFRDPGLSNTYFWLIDVVKGLQLKRVKVKRRDVEAKWREIVENQ